jgi:hypothetical protein
VRKNDRDYKVGDYLELKEFTNGDYTDRSILVQITYVLDNPNYCKANYVILGIVPINIEVF